MTQIKRTVEFLQTNTFRGERLYKVMRLTNTIEPKVGEMVPEREVNEMIGMLGWTVVIKGEK